MTDLEIVKKCAEKMGWTVQEMASGGFRVKEGRDVVGVIKDGPTMITRYNPLHDDAQAMALVKKFGGCFLVKADGRAIVSINQQAVSADNLNRAICECVAKLP